MKKILKLVVLILTISFASCEDFLDRAPLDEVSEASFYTTADHLKAAVSGFYNDLPGWTALSVGINTLPDMNTDTGISTSPSNRFVGIYTVATTSNNTQWRTQFINIREINWLIDHLDQVSADEDETLVNQYSGEAYFFRAYYYFELLTAYGDLPIFDQYFDNTDEEYVFAARDPRNEVVDFMLEDLDTAISLLQSFPNIDGHPRVSKEAAQLFKARVALYEGTWEKYHSGTVYGVDGSDGSTYLQIAADAAEDVIDGGVFSLHSDYKSLFNQVGYSGNTEVMLWRDYNSIEFGQANILQQQWPNGSGFTRFSIESYLCTDGLPTALSPLFTDGDDDDLTTIEDNRDPRLAASLMVPGDIVQIDPDGTETYWEYPNFAASTATLTGYEFEKYRNVYYDETYTNFTEDTSRIIFRLGEALLIFAEAKAELGTITQADLDKSINELRERAGMPGITLGAIPTDPNWPDYGYTLSNILYEVRRERTVELLAEGFRADDLYRWRAHNLFDGDQPRGAYLEDGTVNTTISASELTLDEDGYILPFASFLGGASGAYDFDEDKAYLISIPTDEIILNPNLTQNPGWE